MKQNVKKYRFFYQKRTKSGYFSSVAKYVYHNLLIVIITARWVVAVPFPPTWCFRASRAPPVQAGRPGYRARLRL